MLDLEYAQASDRGTVRTKNEDALGCALPEDPARGCLFALADGVGGQAKGDVASRVAVDTLVAEFQRDHGNAPLRTLLPRLVQTANQKVIDAGWASKSPAAMATTVVACALRWDRAVVSHVGDSRCYAIRDGRATALTRDHTLSGKRLGVLTRSLGNDLSVRVDTSEHQVYAGDVFLLCSDGLHRAVSADQIAEAVTFSRSMEDAAGELVEAAHRRGVGDDISIQLIRIHAVERAARGGWLYKTA